MVTWSVPQHSGTFLGIEPLQKGTESHSNEKFECVKRYFSQVHFGLKEIKDVCEDA